MVLELAQLVASEEEQSGLRGSLTMTELNDIAISIEEKAFDKMWELEGKNPSVEKTKNIKAGSKSKTATYIPLGRRLHNYKTNVLKDGEATLQERPEVVVAVVEQGEQPDPVQENTTARLPLPDFTQDRERLSKVRKTTQTTLFGKTLSVAEEREALNNVPK